MANAVFAASRSFYDFELRFILCDRKILNFELTNVLKKPESYPN